MKKELEVLIEEDPLIKSMMDSVGKEIDVIAFGISYVGTLKKIDGRIA